MDKREMPLSLMKQRVAIRDHEESRFPSTDEQSVTLAREGYEEAFGQLVRRYEWLVRSTARRFFLQGGEFDDLIQEGMIGLFKATRDYRPELGSFRGFVELCVTRQIITAVKTASRLKHIPLNYAQSLTAPAYDNGLDQDRTLVEILDDKLARFDTTLMETDDMRKALGLLRSHLSPFEYSALLLWLEGHSYSQIGRKLQKQTKAVDNGLWRVKCKARRLANLGVLAR